MHNSQHIEPNAIEQNIITGIEDAPVEEKQAALKAAIEVGLAQIKSGDYITGTVDELMVGIEKRLPFERMKLYFDM